MKTTKRTNRRKFLLAAGLGGAGVAAAVVAPGRKVPGSEASAAGSRPDGYHVSEHILKYYKTAEV